MGRDFRIGLMAGVVLAGAAVIWVATRPSLGPQAAQTQNLASGPSPAPADDPLAPEGPEAVAAVALPSVPAPLTESQPPAPLATSEETPKVLPSRVPPDSPFPSPGHRDLTIYELSEPIQTTKFHIVRRGESLSAISRQYYGSPNQWRKILEANPKVIKDPNKIAPGTKLILPD